MDLPLLTSGTCLVMVVVHLVGGFVAQQNLCVRTNFQTWNMVASFRYLFLIEALAHTISRDFK